MDARRLFSNFSLVVLGIILIMASVIFWFTKSSTYFFWTVLILGIISTVAGIVLALLPQKVEKLPKYIKEKTYSTPSPTKRAPALENVETALGESCNINALKRKQDMDQSIYVLSSVKTNMNDL
jgi:hypothetical protein